jgi:putative DNA primase/helicase
MAADIIRSFRGEPNRKLSNKRQLRWGRKGSLALNIEGPKTGLWFDHENSIGGDVIDFFALELRCSAAQAIAHALDFVGACSTKPDPAIQSGTDDIARISKALRIWSMVLPLNGSLAEQYLAHRGISVPNCTLPVLGFHPTCPFHRRRAPALVALIEDIITGEPVGIHRRELNSDGTPAGSAMSLGPKSGGAIKLSEPGRSGELVVAEGLETSLSGMILGYGATWSVLDAAGISNFPILDYIHRLIILVDNDESGTGQRAGANCRDRWLAAGKHVRLITPERPGHDMNDVLLASASCA